MSVPFILSGVVQALILLVIVEVIISYMIQFGVRVSPYHPVIKFVRRIVDPLLNPIRRMMPPYKFGGWDLSPLIVIVLLQVVQRMLYRYSP